MDAPSSLAGVFGVDEGGQDTVAGAILLLEEPTYAARAAHAQSCPYCRLRFIFVSVSNHFLGTVYLDMRH